MSDDTLIEEVMAEPQPAKNRRRKRAKPADLPAQKKPPKPTASRPPAPQSSMGPIPLSGVTLPGGRIPKFDSLIEHFQKNASSPRQPRRSIPDSERPVPTARQDREPEQSDPTPQEPLTEFEQLVQNALEKKPGSGQALRQHLKTKPHIYNVFGDTASLARGLLIDLLGAGNPIYAQSIQIKTEELLERYREVCDTCPTEGILIEQVVVNKLRLDFYDCKSPNYADGAVPKLVKMMQDRHSSAQSQLYRAIGKLEEFRRLKLVKEQ